MSLAQDSSRKLFVAAPTRTWILFYPTWLPEGPQVFGNSLSSALSSCPVCLLHWRTSSPNSLCFEPHFHLGCIRSSPVVWVTSVNDTACTPKRVIAFSPLFNPRSHSCFQILSFLSTNKRCTANAKGKCQSWRVFICLVLRGFFRYIFHGTLYYCASAATQDVAAWKASAAHVSYTDVQARGWRPWRCQMWFLLRILYLVYQLCLSLTMSATSLRTQ